MLNRWGDVTSTTLRLWSLSDDALVEAGAEPGSLTVVTRWGELLLAGVDAVTAESLRRMGFGPVTLRNTLPVMGGVGRSSGDGAEQRRAPDAVEALELVLDRLSSVVVHSLGLPDGLGPLMSVVPVVADPAFRPGPVAPARPVRLSRFATLRPADGALLLEVPGAPFRVLLCRPAARALVTALVAPVTAAGLVAITDVARAVVDDLVSFLAAAGVVLVGSEAGDFAEDHDPVVRGWAHHELLFHQRSRSRQGHLPADVVLDEVAHAAPPVTRPLPPGKRFVLFRPDLAALAVADPTLTALLETDHACPQISEDALGAEQLGELLFRCARIRSTGPAHVPAVGAGTGYDASQRPYFNVACLYELELYLTLNRCAGLPRGIYHYDPLGHALTLIDTEEGHLDVLLDIGKVGAGSTQQPAVLVSVTARMERSSWLLFGASYAVALMHCGVLQETLYLCAKAMGISAHAVPTDANDVADPILGLGWPAEVGVGECILDPIFTA